MKRLTTEWLWFIIGLVVAVAFVAATAPGFNGYNIAVYAVALSVPIYIAMGAIRLTVWAVRSALSPLHPIQ